MSKVADFEKAYENAQIKDEVKVVTDDLMKDVATLVDYSHSAMTDFNEEKEFVLHMTEKQNELIQKYIPRMRPITEKLCNAGIPNVQPWEIDLFTIKFTIGAVRHFRMAMLLTSGNVQIVSSIEQLIDVLKSL